MPSIPSLPHAGLFVASKPGNVPRVAGSLAMSRAMGDVKYKVLPSPCSVSHHNAVPASPCNTTFSPMHGTPRPHQHARHIYDPLPFEYFQPLRLLGKIRFGS